MQPTFQINDRVLLDHRRSLHGQWQRGDVILFNVPENWKDSQEDEDTLFKRVIGLPGETVEIRADGPYINGEKLSEPYLRGEHPGYESLTTPLGPGQYFVMGDNRNNSEDSRDHGPVGDSDIRGRVVFQLYPFSELGRIVSPDYTAAPVTQT